MKRSKMVSILEMVTSEGYMVVENAENPKLTVPSIRPNDYRTHPY